VSWYDSTAASWTAAKVEDMIAINRLSMMMYMNSRKMYEKARPSSDGRRHLRGSRRGARGPWSRGGGMARAGRVLGGRCAHVCRSPIEKIDSRSVNAHEMVAASAPSCSASKQKAGGSMPLSESSRCAASPAE
jgi:hypothetical protein